MRRGGRRPGAGWRRRCAVAILLCATRSAAGEGAAQEATAGQLRQAVRADYVLQCAGCHRVDGRGSSRHGIPDFRNSVGAFVRLPAGREYLIRVPGAAQSQLDDAELAAVLNWVLEEFSAAQLPVDFRPYTGQEVAAARPRRYEDVVPVRHGLAQSLSEQGFDLAEYSYGSDRKP
ncbi:MAG: c-type cytochrome [Achromobacter sp.]|uniref:c-type cytochrome n=1 Tax=Achromobacter sp. TaxID=134375 RepID=UPI003D01F1DC